MKIEQAQINKIKLVLPHLDERLKRIYLASEAEALGRGGAKEISSVFGIHQNTLTAGKKDLHSGEVLISDDGNFFTTRHKGAGRKTVVENHPEVIEALNRLIDGESFGNPENPLRWTTKSLRNLSDELKSEGISVGHVTVGKLLEQMGFSLQINQKMNQIGSESPDRDAQFKHINETVKIYSSNGNPVISVDCKKKENIGNFKNNGAEYAPKKNPVKVLDHDFPLPENGKAVPYF
jgi:transposase